MQGKIIKGIAGFYYVYAQEIVYECKAKGIFRKDHVKPLVGDNVELEIIDIPKEKGNITAILPRKNELIRPAVANVDQALIIFAITRPEPNFNLLDRFLIQMEQQGLESVICFNKKDIATGEEQERLQKAYETCGYRVLFCSALEKEGLEEVSRCLQGKTTAIAGPSGVGKSSLINALSPHAHMETGEISVKIERGKHTTRHSEIIALSQDTYIIDTPGFTSMALFQMEKEELAGFYREFQQYEPECRFAGCAHISEPDCGIKRALAEGKISQTRYENYKLLYEELKNSRKY